MPAARAALEATPRVQYNMSLWLHRVGNQSASLSSKVIWLRDWNGRVRCTSQPWRPIEDCVRVGFACTRLLAGMSMIVSWDSREGQQPCVDAASRSVGRQRHETEQCAQRTGKLRHLVRARPTAVHSSPHPLHCLLPLRPLLVLFAALQFAIHSSLFSADTTCSRNEARSLTLCSE